jgi:muramoyltetrapeptide carboxypeptidase
MKPLIPARLKKGDLIGVISPASPVSDPSKIQRGVAYLERNGYRVLEGESVGKTCGYLAGTDAERAKDINKMFSDKRVKAIVCIRGGYGTPRLLPLLNYKLLSRNPKILVGFSDITALQLAIWKKCHLMTFHGPMLGVDFADQIDPYTEELFWRMVTSTKKIGKVPVPDEAGHTVLYRGSSSGRLLGGNLSLIASLMGTSFQPDFAGALLFIEDIGEEPYRIDRMMTQLRHASVLSKVRGILAGQFTDCMPKDPSEPSFSVEQILSEFAAFASKPFLSNLPFGHTAKKLTLPIGLRVKVDTDKRSIEYLEPAVC